jgi:hypothetical protein
VRDRRENGWGGSHEGGEERWEANKCMGRMWGPVVGESGGDKAGLDRRGSKEGERERVLSFELFLKAAF